MTLLCSEVGREQVRRRRIEGVGDVAVEAFEEVSVDVEDGPHRRVPGLEAITEEWVPWSMRSAHGYVSCRETGTVRRRRIALRVSRNVCGSWCDAATFLRGR
jgi:hypothetical protein